MNMEPRLLHTQPQTNLYFGIQRIHFFRVAFSPDTYSVWNRTLFTDVLSVYRPTFSPLALLPQSPSSLFSSFALFIFILHYVVSWLRHVVFQPLFWYLWQLLYLWPSELNLGPVHPSFDLSNNLLLFLLVICLLLNIGSINATLSQRYWSFIFHSSLGYSSTTQYQISEEQMLPIFVSMNIMLWKVCLIFDVRLSIH